MGSYLRARHADLTSFLVITTEEQHPLQTQPIAEIFKIFWKWRLQKFLKVLVQSRGSYFLESLRHNQPNSNSVIGKIGKFFRIHAFGFCGLLLFHHYNYHYCLVITLLPIICKFICNFTQGHIGTVRKMLPSKHHFSKYHFTTNSVSLTWLLFHKEIADSIWTHLDADKWNRWECPIYSYFVDILKIGF